MFHVRNKWAIIPISLHSPSGDVEEPEEEVEKKKLGPCSASARHTVKRITPELTKTKGKAT